MKYYITPKDGLGYRHAISEREGKPVNMTGVDIISLPDGDYLTVISRGKKYPAYKVALAVAAGQIKLSDITNDSKYSLGEKEMLFEDIAGTKGGKIFISDSKTVDNLQEMKIHEIVELLRNGWKFISNMTEKKLAAGVTGIIKNPFGDPDLDVIKFKVIDSKVENQIKIKQEVDGFWSVYKNNKRIYVTTTKEKAENAVNTQNYSGSLSSVFKDTFSKDQFNVGDIVKITQGILEEEIAGVKGGRAVVKDSKTGDSLQYIKVIPKDFHLVEVYGQYRIYSDGKVFKAVRKDSPIGIVGNSLSYVKERIDSSTTDSLYKGQKVTAIKSEEGLREGETYTVIRGEKPITQSSEAEIKTVYVLQDSSGNLVTVSGCEDLFYKTEDANPIYSVRKNLRTGAIEYDKGGNWLPIEGKIKEAFENEQYIFSRTDKEGYAHYTVQVMDSTDTFTKGEALKVKIGEIQKNMDAARKMGYDTAQYQKEIDKLQEDTYTGDPLTEKGKEIMKAMKEQYGEEEGEQVFYASKNKGSISGVDKKTKDEGVSLQTYRGKTFGITKKNGMFEAIFLFDENHIKAPSEQEVINKAKAKIDQFFKNRTGDKKQKEVR